MSTNHDTLKAAFETYTAENEKFTAKGVKASAEKKVEKEKEEAGIKEAELPAAPAAQEVGKEVPAAPDAEEGDKEVPAAAEPKEEEAPAIEVNVEGAIDTEKEVK